MGIRGFVAALLVGFSGAGGAQVSAKQAEAWESALHTALYAPKVSELPKLESKVWSTFAPVKGVLADRVTYATQDGMLVPAVVYRPDPKARKWHGKLPGVVVVNGHGSDKYGWYAQYSGMMLAEAGAVVLTYDPAGEGERNSGKLSAVSPSAHDVVPEGVDKEEWGRRVTGLMQVDLMQAISYMRSLPEVDAKRVGVVGYSMGAYVTGLQAALDYYDHRIAAVVLSGGGVWDNEAGGYFDRNKSTCQAAAYRALLPALGPKRGEILFALDAGRPTLIMNGTEDTVMDIPHHEADWFAGMKSATAKDFGIAPEALFTSVMYPGASHRPSWVNVDGVEWLNKQLHFAFWDTDARIAAQGTTHVSEWLAATGVPISKNYAPETREGGIVAVGTGLPGLTRMQLSVLPEADWERLKGRLVWEAWRDKTVAVMAEEKVR